MIPNIPTGMEGLLGVDFFTYVLPWLLTFAIVYGITSHIGDKGIPQSKAARVIIALVLAFIVAPVMGPWVTVFMGIIGSLVIVVAGLLVFIVFLEIMGIKSVREVTDKEGKTLKGRFSIFETHGIAFAIIFIIIGALVFISSGGLQALGWSMPIELVYNWPLIFFLIIIALAIWWMSSEK